MTINLFKLDSLNFGTQKKLKIEMSFLFLFIFGFKNCTRLNSLYHLTW